MDKTRMHNLRNKSIAPLNNVFTHQKFQALQAHISWQFLLCQHSSDNRPDSYLSFCCGLVLLLSS